MFTRDELVSKSLLELQQLGNNLGVNPIGNPNNPASWIVPLLASTQMAMNKCEQGLGLKRFPDARIIQQVEGILDSLGQPTPAQRTIIKGALQGIWIKRADERAVQQRLLTMWIVRMNFLEALAALR